MKRLVYNAMLILATMIGFNTMNSCSHLVDEIVVPVPFSIPLNFNAQIPLATLNTSDYVTYPEIPMNIDIDAEIKKKYSNFSAKNLKSARLESFNIEHVSSQNGFKLDAIRNARIYIKTPELNEQLIATAAENTSETKIVFTPENTDLIKYLKSKQNSLIFEIQGRQIAADQLNVKINSSFRIEVGL